MGNSWWETKEYMLKDGRWVPQVHIGEEVSNGIEITRLLSPNAVSFQAQEEARAFSTAMGVKFLSEKLLPRARDTDGT